MWHNIDRDLTMHCSSSSVDTMKHGLQRLDIYLGQVMHERKHFLFLAVMDYWRVVIYCFEQGLYWTIWLYIASSNYCLNCQGKSKWLIGKQRGTWMLLKWEHNIIQFQAAVHWSWNSLTCRWKSPVQASVIVPIACSSTAVKPREEQP